MSNKNLLILGASSDVGCALIKELYNDYDMIIAHYCNNCQSLDDLILNYGDKIKKFQANFLNDKSTDEMIVNIEKLKSDITHIVHLPALNIKNIKFEKLKWEDIEKELTVELKSVYKVLNKFLPLMAKKRYGKIVFMLSSNTYYPAKYQSNYITAKYALLGLMKALSHEYAGKKVNINAVSPSMMETKFLNDIAELIIQKNAEDNPMKRNANVQDVVPIIKMLLSDSAEFITGQNILISGGSI